MDHPAPAPFTLPVEPAWSAAEVVIEHPDYLPWTLLLRWEADGSMSWGDPATQSSSAGGNTTLKVPLGRIRIAPGQLPPFKAPTGDEKGVYVEQLEGRPQRYGGIGLQLLPLTQPLRLLEDYAPVDPRFPTCILSPHSDDGWQRFSAKDAKGVDPASNGGFAWLEYGSPDTLPTQPRFLIAVWIPNASAVKDGKLDVLTFFSPSTANALYPTSKYPFRDKYPYSANAREVTDPETGEKFAAKVQPYVLLGNKYLFRPTYIVPMTIASEKPLLVVMPIFPHVAGPHPEKHQGQPFSSQAGLQRLLIEIAQFLEREGYTGTSFSFNRFNGRVAPISGAAPPPPPPTFSPSNRTRLGIRRIVVAGYSSGSAALNALFRNTTLTASAADYPPELFGADPAEFDKRWHEIWGLDLFLNESKTGIKRVDFEKALREWLSRDSRRLRLYHGGWTLEGLEPDAFYPRLRKQLSAAPRFLRDAALASRWTADWREPAGHWSACFFSSPALRAVYVDPVSPDFPISTPDGSKGDAASAVHGFAMQLGLGHAAKLRDA